MQAGSSQFLLCRGPQGIVSAEADCAAGGDNYCSIDEQPFSSNETKQSSSQDFCALARYEPVPTDMVDCFLASLLVRVSPQLPRDLFLERVSRTFIAPDYRPVGANLEFI